MPKKHNSPNRLLKTLISDIQMPDSCSDIETLSYYTYGAAIVSYVWWVLNNAQSQGIKKIWFLARDGHILYKIAKIICEKEKLDIECRYLYCSRLSLRIPAYHILKDKAYEYIFNPAAKQSADAVMKRTGLSGKEISAVYADIDFDEKSKNNPFGDADLAGFSEKLKGSKLFNDFLNTASKREYKNIIGYFRQEGLLDSNEIAVADSGWSGSMQKFLRLLLDNEGYNGSITGYYFGLYKHPDEKRYGKFNTFYFDEKSPIGYKIKFCNNLLECMLSAPHGMTLGYAFDGEKYTPVTETVSDSYSELVAKQERGIERLAADITDYSAINKLGYKKLHSLCRKVLKSAMVYPSAEEARILGGFDFCDDCSDSYHQVLAESVQTALLTNYLMLPRIINKIKGTTRSEKAFLFWPYGTIAFLPKSKQGWYRLNVYIWEWLRYKLT